MNTAKNPRLKAVELAALHMVVEIPKQVALASVALRVVRREKVRGAGRWLCIMYSRVQRWDMYTQSHTIYSICTQPSPCCLQYVVSGPIESF